jgi:hypothetical protein
MDNVFIIAKNNYHVVCGIFCEWKLINFIITCNNGEICVVYID